MLDTRHEPQANELQNWKQTQQGLADMKKSQRELQIPKPLDWGNNDASENQEHATQ